MRATVAQAGAYVNLKIIFISLLKIIFIFSSNC